MGCEKWQAIQNTVYTGISKKRDTKGTSREKKKNMKPIIDTSKHLLVVENEFYFYCRLERIDFVCECVWVSECIQLKFPVNKQSKRCKHYLYSLQMRDAIIASIQYRWQHRSCARDTKFGAIDISNRAATHNYYIHIDIASNQQNNQHRS